jgi:hypothetical protein
MDSLRGIQQERLFYLEFLALFTGKISRKDLVSRFGISEPAATKDLSLYDKLAPNVIRYDVREKTYVFSSTGKLLFSHDMDQSLYSLSGKRAIAINSEHAKRLPNWVDLSIKRKTPIDLVSTITRSIYQNLEMKAKYFSLSSGNKKRTLSPLALVNDGLRWHIRCYDHEKKRFGDYNLARFTEAKSSISSTINLDNDTEWNKQVTLILIPHPNLKHPETVCIDFDIVEGIKKVKLKACLVGYFLRHWHIDYSDKASGNPQAQQLFLDNKEELVQSGIPDWTFK